MKGYLAYIAALLVLSCAFSLSTGWNPASAQIGPTPGNPNVTNAVGTLGANHGGTGVANNVAATLTRSGSHALTITTTGTTGVTLPTSGTLSTATAGSSVTLTSGDISTTSATLVDLTGVTLTFATGANPVLCGLSATATNGTINQNTFFNIAVDGALQLGTQGIRQEQAVAAKMQPVALSIRTAALSAASHTFKVQWMNDGGTSTLKAGTAQPVHFWCQEVN